LGDGIHFVKFSSTLSRLRKKKQKKELNLDFSVFSSIVIWDLLMMMTQGNFYTSIYRRRETRT
jgi:hypothetical protein